MATAEEIIDEAYRENNLIPIGAAPTGPERTEALARLNNIVLATYGTLVGEWLTDWETPPKRATSEDARWPRNPANTELPSDVWPYPPPNARLITNLTKATTVYLYPQPDDGAVMEVANAGEDFSTYALTINANSRRIEGADTVDLTGTDRTYRWMYRADLAEWVPISTLILSSDMPFPAEFDDYFIATLNLRLCARNAREPLQTTASLHMSLRERMKRRYTQEMASEWRPDGRFFNTYQAYASSFSSGTRWEGSLYAS